jgi:two-component system NtrC family sensor kinase
MSLKLKVVLILLAVFSLYVGLSFVIQRNVFFARFKALEREKALVEMKRIVETLDHEVHHLDHICSDWAAWDTTYQFVRDGNTASIEAHMPREQLVNNGIHLLYFIDRVGNVVWGRVYDSENLQEIRLRAFPTSRFPPSHYLLAHNSPASGLAGILVTERGLLLVAARPIPSHVDGEPVQGTLIMGYFVAEQAVEGLRVHTNLDCDLWPARGELLSASHRGIVEQLRAGEPYWVDDRDWDRLRLYALYPDVYGIPSVLLMVDMPRDITAHGWEASGFALLSVGLAGLLVLLATYLLLEKMVVSPVETVTAHAVTVGNSSDLSARLNLDRADEIGVLAREFDRMVTRLEEAQRRLLEQSYYSGMAEMAAGTLHNIRNALSPMVVQMDALRQKLRGLPIERLQQAQGELARQDISEQRRANVLRFLELVTNRLARVAQESLSDAETIACQAARVEEILAQQVRYSHTERLLEVCRLDSLIQDALPLISPKLRKLATICLDSQLEALPPVKTQRMVLIQVFANLITNALESIQRAGVANGSIAIAGALETTDGLERLHVRVCDNGAGIAADSLEIIFARSFSSKGAVRSGIGLHWCANALTAMNGHIYAESDGPGKGACFHVLLNTLTNVEGHYRL